mmetsp:Transcript_20579/g.28875  ORF Transcript_20579/g.28875 Transcript_20579/m.28875 type:complete len:320 (-) Transcript_20579:58-1017(-)|eukprot:CAMPEP_0168555262 /NCGR_PEP_ID=MMETSP0413-20121227/8236_1 /TAXON_ID=136452 /ORGANISM="Filamoeba nolandi, Strain NC-AS-23-1" /LENGTH=319 /DNA_ID=CAMNT_0008586091 /DNA_START=124 /DNA_END=1083 /DNA_ORIENTATION=+
MDNIEVRLLNIFGDEVSLKFSPSTTVGQIKKTLIQKYQPAFKPEKTFFFFDLRHVPNDTTLQDIQQMQEDSIQQGQIEPSAGTSSLVLVYAYDTLGRFNSTHKSINNERLVQHLFRFDVKGLEADPIMENLYLGNLHAALNLPALQMSGIRRILTIHHSMKPVYPQHFVYMCIEAEDVSYQNLFEHFKDAIEFIDHGRKEGPVLVHCAAGVSRSATLVIAYVMYKLQLSFPSALEYVRNKRRIISPNSGFLRQLQIFDEVQYNSANKNDEHEKELAFCKVGKVMYTGAVSQSTAEELTSRSENTKEQVLVTSLEGLQIA